MKPTFIHVVALSFAVWLLIVPPPTAIGQPAGPSTESLILTGIKQRRSGLHLESIKTLEQAMALAKTNSDVDGESKARAFLALTHEEMGNLHEALALREENLVFVRRHRDQFEPQANDRESDAALAVSASHTLLGNYQKAIEALGPPPPRSLGLRRAHFLQRRGVNLFLAGQLAAADASLTEALTEYEAFINLFLKFGGARDDAYELQVEVLRWLQAVRVAQKRTDEALELAEQGRSREFVALLSARRVMEGVSPRDSLVPGLSQIKQIARTHRSTLVIYSIIYKYAPSLPLQFSGYTGLPVRDIHIWVIKPTGEIEFRKVSFEQRTESLGDLVRLARESIGVRGRGITVPTTGPKAGARQKYDNSHLRRLYEILVRPIAEFLPKDPSARVTFIPQDVLFLLPFAALQDGEGAFLIERHTILTAPSLQVLELSGRRERSTKDRVAGAVIVGNPEMPRLPGAGGRLGEVLDRLPGAEREAMIIAGLLKTQPIIGERATKAAVVSQMSTAEIIHLATHGLLDEIGGNFSAVALAPDKDDGGLLTAREILALRLNTDIVVLSACDTGRGKLNGEGVIGLSRSFIAAGAASVVVSLWQVPDAATVMLMTTFYENLQRGEDKALALRQAMLRTRTQHPDPRDWSAFILIGQADVSYTLRVLVREGVSIPAKPARAPNSDQSPYRYFTFPLPEDVRDYTESRFSLGGIRVGFSTDVSSNQLIAFYRRMLTQQGLVEDTAFLRADNLVFRGLSGGGTIVIQFTRSDRESPKWSVSLRVEPPR